MTLSLGPRIALSIVVAMFGAAGCTADPDPVRPAGSVSSRPTADELIRPLDDDCAIVGEIGNSLMGWKEKMPGFAFPNEDSTEPAFYRFYQEDFVGDDSQYLRDCSLKALGASEADIGSPKADAVFSVWRPEYVANRAQVNVHRRKISWDVYEDFTCTLEKANGRWRVLGCDMTGVH